MCMLSGIGFVHAYAVVDEASMKMLCWHCMNTNTNINTNTNVNTNTNTNENMTKNVVEASMKMLCWRCMVAEARPALERQLGWE